MTQKFFVFVMTLQIVALLLMITVLQRVIDGAPLTRYRIVLGVIALLVQFFGIVYMWVQNARIDDLEYRQEILPEIIDSTRFTNTGTLK